MTWLKLFLLATCIGLATGFASWVDLKVDCTEEIISIKNGFHTEYDDSGRLLADGNYKDGVKNARWCYYFLIDSTFNSPQEKLHYSREFLLKKEGFYKNGIKEYYWKCYYDQGRLEAEGWYSDGQKNKFWKFYNSDGELSQEGHFRNGNKNGWWRAFEPVNKVMRKGQFKKGLKEGYWQRFENDELISVAKYEKGKLLGRWTSYEEYLNWKKD